MKMKLTTFNNLCGVGSFDLLIHKSLSLVAPEGVVRVPLSEKKRGTPLIDRGKLYLMRIRNEKGEK